MRVFCTPLAAIFIVVSCISTGCVTFLKPGSVYRETGKVSDLLLEPTLDVGPRVGQYAATPLLYDSKVPFYDADGHGVFDVPIVATECVFLVPAQVPYGLGFIFRIPAVTLQADIHLDATSLTTTQRFLDFVGQSAAVAGYAFLQPGHVLLYTGMGCLWVYDTLAHDLPVILIGKPAAAFHLHDRP